MSDAVKRTIRTAYVVLVTLAVVVPTALTVVPAHAPLAAMLTGFAGAVVVINRIVTLLEDRGLLPAFLRDVTPRVDVVDQVAAQAASAAADLAPAAADLLEQTSPAAARYVNTAAADITKLAAQVTAAPEPAEPATPDTPQPAPAAPAPAATEGPA